MSEATQEAGAATNQPGGTQQGADGGATTPPTQQGAATTTTPPADDKGAPPAPPAEVKYEFKAPEGVEFDKDRLTKFTELAKTHKLSPEAAQAVVDLEAERVQAHLDLRKQWVDQVKGDKELGGDKLTENLATAQKAFSLLPEGEAAELKSLLNLSGFGDHPSVVRWMHAVGKMLSEDKHVPGSNQPPATPPSTAQRMYPNMNP